MPRTPVVCFEVGECGEVERQVVQLAKNVAEAERCPSNPLDALKELRLSHAASNSRSNFGRSRCCRQTPYRLSAPQYEQQK